jgi:hypothetical protein
MKMNCKELQEGSLATKISRVNTQDCFLRAKIC